MKSWVDTLRLASFLHVKQRLGCRLYAWGGLPSSSGGGNPHTSLPYTYTTLGDHHLHTVVCGAQHTVGISKEGHVWSWGQNDCGQLGHGDCQPLMQPSMIRYFAQPSPFMNSPVVISAAACGHTHTLLLTSQGQVFSFGVNSHGQLGMGIEQHAECRVTPGQVMALSDVPMSLIACGDNYSMARSLTGALFSWGNNQYGQLGIGNQHSQPSPVQVSELKAKRVSKVACGSSHSVVVLKDSREVLSWGKGTSGQLGHGDTGSHHSPRLLQTMQVRFRIFNTPQPPILASAAKFMPFLSLHFYFSLRA